MSLKLTFINVGYGEAMLIRCGETGFTMLVDAGSAEASEYADNVSGRIRAHEYLESIGLERIDLMVSTHVHEDHLCGLLPVVERWMPKVFWHALPDGYAESALRWVDPALAENASQSKFIRALDDYQALCRTLRDGGCKLVTVLSGHREALCDGLDCKVLGPDEAPMAELLERLRRACALPDGAELLKALSAVDGAMNNYSVILRLEYQGASVLLPGDTNRAGYGGIDPADLRADIFKVGHHGQADGASAALIDAVQPRYSVCCASSDRRYNSAHPDLMRMLRDKGARLCFSDCPPVEGIHVPPHQALTFTIGNGDIQVEYA